MRWEAGRLATVRRQAVPLLRLGLRTRNAAALDAAVEQLVPPLSVPFAVASAALAAGVLLREPGVWLFSVLLLVLQTVYVVAGLVLARVPVRVYAALLHVPIYVAWKSMLYLRALLGPRRRRWVRTSRLSPQGTAHDGDEF
jgi:hypothetical protein